MAQGLGWRLTYQRRPSGYWADLGNVRREVTDFIRDGGFDPGAMPARRDFERAGRKDLAKMLDRWGGPAELAKLLARARGPPLRSAGTPSGSSPRRSPLRRSTPALALLPPPALAPSSHLPRAPQGLKPRGMGRRLHWYSHLSEVSRKTGLARNALFEVASATYQPRQRAPAAADRAQQAVRSPAAAPPFPAAAARVSGRWSWRAD